MKRTNRPTPPSRDPLKPSRPRARTSVGQHYLKDRGVMRRIAEAADLSPEHTVIEIGAGPANLTRMLVSTGARVVALEIDQRFEPGLVHLQRESPNLEIAWGDALDVDFDALWGDTAPERRVLVGNLPYQITSPLLDRLTRISGRFSRAVIMIQREVAERLIAEPGTRTRSGLTVKMALDFDIRLLFGVPAKAFRPQPRVQSAVVRLTPVADPPVRDPEQRILVQRLIEAAFGSRRQQLANSLTRHFRPTLEKSTWQETLTDAGIDPQLRAEVLELTHFVHLGKIITEREKTLEPKD